MMIRSAPPSSRALGRQPGAGAGADDHAAAVQRRAQPRPGLVARHRQQLVELGRHRLRERLVVDVAVHLDHLDVAVDATAAPRTAPRRPPGRGTAGPRRRSATRRASGMNSTVGPVAARELAPRSAARAPRTPPRVVRISVTDGLCTYRLRSANCGGTVSRAPKLTMSSAPSDTTCGMPARPAASSRSGPGAEHAADEVVARARWWSRRARRRGTRTRQRLHRAAAGAGRVEDEHLVAALPPARSRAWSTHGVVTPNIVAPTSGSVPSCSTGGAPTIPAIAAAALARICARDRVQPGDVGDRGHQRHVGAADVVARVARRPSSRPSASARPTGSARIAAVAIAVLPGAARAEHAVDAPVARAAARPARAAPVRHRAHRLAAVGQRRDAGRRSPRARCRARRRAAARPCPTSASSTSHPGLQQPRAQERELLALGVQGADQQDGHGRGLHCTLSEILAPDRA